MQGSILVINAGSSSVKFALYTAGEGPPSPTLKGQISGLGTTARAEAWDSGGERLDFVKLPAGLASHDEAFEILIDWLEARGDQIAAAGHRIVHGGGDFTAPVRIDAENLNALRRLAPLAPHHQPHNLAAIAALSARLPDLPQVACFDTAFHASQPPEAQELGLPQSYKQRNIRRYGFHGLSYQSVVDAFPLVTEQPLPSRLVIAHLGNGASMCAIQDGKSIATTMGFSTLDGIPMGTRSGAMDPGVLLHLMREDDLDVDALEDLLYNQCGLVGVSGISADMRELLNSKASTAADAVSYYCYRISRELGSLVAALGGIDALIFTGGIGENAAQVRGNILKSSAWLGFSIDDEANERSDICIASSQNSPSAWVVRTDEEGIIAKHTAQVLSL